MNEESNAKREEMLEEEHRENTRIPIGKIIRERKELRQGDN